MITVCNIVFICHTRNQSKTFLQTFCKFISCGLQRGAIQTKIYVVLCLPLAAGIIHMLHYFQCKRCRTRICVGFTCHIADTFTQSRISERDRRITIMKQFINSLAFFQTGKCAMLPQDRSHIRRCSLQTLMTAHQCTVTKFQSLIKDFPEFVHISLG